MREAFAVHFQTEGLFACTSDLALLAGISSSVDVRDAFAERVGLERRGLREVDVFEGGLRGDGVVGVDHFEGKGALWQFVVGGEVEEGDPRCFIVHAIIIL